MPALSELGGCGQSVWLDYVDRKLLQDGGLQRLLDEGLTGVTSNPTIFDAAIAADERYGVALGNLAKRFPDAPTEELGLQLMLQDVGAAADLLRAVYDSTEGDDGYVSIEVAPRLAHDRDGTVAAARRLWRELGRPNVMIKVPGTPAGLAALEILLREGINVNVTLLFAISRYERVASAYLKGIARAREPGRVRSVASFFVSRVDSKIDRALDGIGTAQAQALRGKAAVANAALAYRHYRELFDGPGFTPQRERGAREQKLLWASTSTKNAAYSDVLYVDSLIGADTINTMAPKTLEAWRDHGSLDRSGLPEVAHAQAVWEELDALGIDTDAALDALEREGVEAFAKSYEQFQARIDAKLGRARGGASAAP